MKLITKKEFDKLVAQGADVDMNNVRVLYEPDDETPEIKNQIDDSSAHFRRMFQTR